MVVSPAPSPAVGGMAVPGGASPVSGIRERSPHLVHRGGALSMEVIVLPRPVGILLVLYPSPSLQIEQYPLPPLSCSSERARSSAVWQRKLSEESAVPRGGQAPVLRSGAVSSYVDGRSHFRPGQSARAMRISRAVGGVLLAAILPFPVRGWSVQSRMGATLQHVSPGTLLTST